MARVRRVPQRTCVACGTTEGKRQLIRIVRTPEGTVEVDPTGKRNGRGAYLCHDAACLAALKRGQRLEQALRVTMAPEQRSELFAQLEALLGSAP